MKETCYLLLMWVRCSIILQQRVKYLSCQTQPNFSGGRNGLHRSMTHLTNIRSSLLKKKANFMYKKRFLVRYVLLIFLVFCVVFLVRYVLLIFLVFCLVFLVRYVLLIFLVFCVVFLFCLSCVLCSQCCQFLWNVRSRLSRRFSLTFFNQ